MEKKQKNREILARLCTFAALHPHGLLHVLVGQQAWHSVLRIGINLPVLTTLNLKSEDLAARVRRIDRASSRALARFWLVEHAYQLPPVCKPLIPCIENQPMTSWKLNL